MFFISCQDLFLLLSNLHFCPDFLVLIKNGLMRKLWLILKFMASQTGQQIITIHIFPNTLRSKCNQAMKFGQLIEYNMRNIFLEKLYKKCCGEASPRLFYKNSKLSISLNEQPKML